jgi:SAM-dependent methyltransferase
MLLIGKSYFFSWREERRLKRRFYSYPLFRCCDKALKRAYRWHNPYSICKRFLIQKKAKEIHAYGETPLTTWHRIVKECAIHSHDHVVDLGCGRGRGVFFLATVVGCHTHGIDWAPSFIQRAVSIKQKFALSRAHFTCEDMCQADLSHFSFVYLYGTCLDDLSLQRLLHLFRTLNPGTRILSVSYPLEPFTLLTQFPAAYPWGTTDLFLHQV